MEKYEKPVMEIIELEKEDMVVYVSNPAGSTVTENP